MIAPTTPFDVVILYDTAHSRACAARLYQRLRRNLEAEYRFHMHSWRFSTISHPSVALWAKRDSSLADMVIVAWGGEDSGLNSIKGWLQEWPAGARDSRRALVSLFTGPHAPAKASTTVEGTDILRRLADRTGMDLMSSHSILPEGAATPASEEVHGLPALPPEPSFQSAPPSSAGAIAVASSRASFRHGGINE